MIEDALTAVAGWVAAHPVLAIAAGLVGVAAAGAARGVLLAVSVGGVLLVLAGVGVLAAATDVFDGLADGVYEVVQDVLPDMTEGR